jgi:hypothetical protein
MTYILGYEFNPAHSFFGGYGWMLSKDNWFVFIPFPILEVEAVVLFVMSFGFFYDLMWVHP